MKKNRKMYYRMILVYQMGKVGSCTIYNLLKQLQYDEVHHIHHIFTNLNDNEKKNRATKLLTKIQNYPTKIKIVTIVRNPVRRNISAFFQNFENFIKDDEMAIRADKIFWDKYDHLIPNKWFENEFKKLTGIDVFEQGFNISQGYQIYENAKFSVLLLRLEDLEKNIPVINKFFNVTITKLPSLNMSSNKKYLGKDNYKDIYQKIISTIPQNIIEELAKTKYVKTFYPNLDLFDLS